MIRPIAVLVVATTPAWSADFAERWPQPVAVDPAPVPVTIEPTPIAAPRARPDICSRHHMHKVITSGGKSWRCRK
jgi:hypothetical protein